MNINRSPLCPFENHCCKVYHVHLALAIYLILLPAINLVTVQIQEAIHLTRQSSLPRPPPSLVAS